MDYGRGAPTIHPETGKYRRPWLFCLKLSHSRKAFRKVVWKSSSRVWCELHEEAFRYFGGVPEVIRLDNLKEGVIKADFYDPELNPLYAALLTHYHVIASPCRVATPRHKGKVESEVKYVQNALKGRAFECLEDQQRFLDHWGQRWADTRIHGTIKRQVNELFETEEKPALKPLPIHSFPLLEIALRKVHPDGHVAVGGAFYSAPHAWVGREVVVHVGRCFVDLLNPLNGERLARHAVITRGIYRTEPNHLPESKRSDRVHERLLQRAHAVGPGTHALVQRLLQERPHHAIRASQGVLSLARCHCKEDLEAAASLCVDQGLFSYRALRRLLDRRPKLKPKLLLTQSHDLIRPSSDYQALWAAHQQGDNP